MNFFDKFQYFSKIYGHEWISVNGTQYGDIKICDTQVFRALTGCQRDTRFLGCHGLVLECDASKPGGHVDNPSTSIIPMDFG